MINSFEKLVEEVEPFKLAIIYNNFGANDHSRNFYNSSGWAGLTLVPPGDFKSFSRALKLWSNTNGTLFLERLFFRYYLEVSANPLTVGLLIARPCCGPIVHYAVKDAFEPSELVYRDFGRENIRTPLNAWMDLKNYLSTKLCDLCEAKLEVAIKLFEEMKQ